MLNGDRILQHQDVWWIVGFLIVAGLAIRHLKKQRRPHVIELTTFHSLSFSTYTVYSELHDLANWWQWDGEVNSSCVTTGQPGVGQVLFEVTGPPLCGLEIIQAWKDRRLRLVSQSLADGYTRWEQLDLWAEGAFCRLQWHTRLESSAFLIRTPHQLGNLKRSRLQVMAKLQQHLNYRRR
ncbi:MAG: hypothetical protein VW875_17455 [Planctomycetaceae bacterium]